MQSQCKSCMLRVSGITKSCITMSYENKMAFFFLSANLLALVVSASSVKTSKGVVFLPFCFIFLISASSFWESRNHFLIGNFHFFIKTQDKRQTLGLSSPISLLTKATIWTLQLLVQNWSKTPLSARSSVWRRILVCPSTWQIWMITLTICYVNCFHLTITPIQISLSPTIFGITTVLR